MYWFVRLIEWRTSWIIIMYKCPHGHQWSFRILKVPEMMKLTEFLSHRDPGFLMTFYRYDCFVTGSYQKNSGVLTACLTLFPSHIHTENWICVLPVCLLGKQRVRALKNPRVRHDSGIQGSSPRRLEASGNPPGVFPAFKKQRGFVIRPVRTTVLKLNIAYKVQVVGMNE